ncbi:MAG TPA: acetyl-coenzyme A synthetase N-terminal domain-containing protein, partial [Candidatus Binatus sp.]|nr:acetyl-coenzyme A synthetase N-terminal domain-containing protein [Candidatus Binatus sp.]
MSNPPSSLEALLEEGRRFPPSQEFHKNANQNDPRVYDRANKDIESFWAEQAERLDWIRKWDHVL